MAVDERDRDEIFQDYIDELFAQEREDALEKTQKNVEGLKELFKNSKLSVEARWREIQETFESEDVWRKSEPLDRLTAFEEYIKALEKEDYIQRKNER
jgi:pre-mRNA-processing factor 40